MSRAIKPWEAQVAELAAVIDELGVRENQGSSFIRQALRAAGQRVDNNLVTAAVRYRREGTAGPSWSPRRPTGEPGIWARVSPKGLTVFEVRVRNKGKVNSVTGLRSMRDALAAREVIGGAPAIPRINPVLSFTYWARDQRPDEIARHLREDLVLLEQVKRYREWLNMVITAADSQ